MDERGPKEVAYDAEIAPLMTTIIAVCKRERIPIMASFQLDGDLACTTQIVPALETVAEEERQYVLRFRQVTDEAVRALRGIASFIAMTISSPRRG